ncbi:MAG: nucleotidyltransferase family protein [Halanaerobiaceae bacterium]
MKIDVLILAGAKNEGPLKKYTSESHEALIKIREVPMVEYILNAVKSASYTDKIAIVGPKKELNRAINQKIDLIVDSVDSMMGNIKKGIKKLNPRNYVLIICSDIPLITEKIIDEFIDSCEKEEADIYYPIISKQNTLDKFPDIDRTYVRLAEGTFTGGNMAVIRPEIIKDALTWFEKVIVWRKKPWKLSRILGIKFIFKFIFGNLSIKEIEKRVTEVIGYKGLGLIIDYPEVGYDVDKPTDLELMEREYISN